VVEAEIARVGQELGDVVAEGRLGVAVLHVVPPRARKHHRAHEAGEGREAVHPVRRARLHLHHQLAGAQRGDDLHDAQRVEQLVEGALLAGRAEQGHEALDARYEHHAQGPQGHAAGVGG
jgi:hypothetical protein